MTRRLELFGFSYSTLLVWTTLSLTALSLSTQVSAQDQQPLRCVQGWGSDQVKVPPHWINDGYCDCPFDGADESNTDACSGIDGRPGSTSDQQVTYVLFHVGLDGFFLLFDDAIAIWMDFAYGCYIAIVAWCRLEAMRSDAPLFYFTPQLQPLTESDLLYSFFLYYVCIYEA
jgi:hypothetical protein